MKTKLRSFFEERKEVLFAYLFGSTAKGSPNALSDIDIAVFVNPSEFQDQNYRYGYQASLASHLMSFLKTNQIDLVILNEAPALLKQKIFSRGIEIFCRDRKVEKEFRMNSLREYLDTVVLRQIQATYLNRRLKELGPHPHHG